MSGVVSSRGAIVEPQPCKRRVMGEEGGVNEEKATRLGLAASSTTHDASYKIPSKNSAFTLIRSCRRLKQPSRLYPHGCTVLNEFYQRIKNVDELALKNWGSNNLWPEWQGIKADWWCGKVIVINLARKGLWMPASSLKLLCEIDSLTHLYLAENRLTGTIPAALCLLTSLEVLDLSNNRLTGAIPVALCNLGCLRKLNLSNNSLTGVIPEALGDLMSLTQLDLSNNFLSGTIPIALCNLGRLQALNLSNNFLTRTIVDQKLIAFMIQLGDKAKLEGNYLLKKGD